ncbi:uncharacterized protein LOC129262177 [Lytechinus pictus]|nr:uncharacterized protein LOC129262177 [Lytechinus pictus]
MESGSHSLVPPVSAMGHRMMPGIDLPGPGPLSMFPDYSSLLGLHSLPANSSEYQDLDLYSLLQSDRIQYPPPPYYIDQQGASRSSSVATSSTTSRAGSTGSGHGIGPPDVIPLD